MRNDTMKHRLGGTTGTRSRSTPIQLRPPTASRTTRTSWRRRRCTGKTINIADAYNAPGFDFSGHARLRREDRLSLAIVPDRADEEPRAEVVGVLQLINARIGGRAHDRRSRRKILPLVEALASQAAVALDNQMLIDAQKNLFRAVHPDLRQRDRRQIALYRRPLPARARADQDAGRGGGRGDRAARSPIST